MLITDDITKLILLKDNTHKGFLLSFNFTSVYEVVMLKPGNFTETTYWMQIINTHTRDAKRY